MYSTQMTVTVPASPAEVYRALLDADSIARWRVPDDMTAHVHEFDAREGGRFRVSLTYELAGADAPRGKTTGHTDTYHGRFVSLVPDQQVVEATEFETDDPALRGEMRMTTTLTAHARGTDVTIVHEGIPDAVPKDQNEAGTRMALARLARLFEQGDPPTLAP
ncbi:SRPBCC domain-containing protein [Nocardioides sp.]|uniref:SRPBCC domain-containing protein n=1 Tax=Nocardioides sp. TaxID=35761 RepID=UPI002D7E2041|nr:SRPBCC domain-containing protein [Nocardioides sp.]HET8961678.1 SRPBCC domain-containing protein [Nocardioides sp.]